MCVCIADREAHYLFFHSPRAGLDEGAWLAGLFWALFKSYSPQTRVYSWGKNPELLIAALDYFSSSIIQGKGYGRSVAGNVTK